MRPERYRQDYERYDDRYYPRSRRPMPQDRYSRRRIPERRPRRPIPAAPLPPPPRLRARDSNGVPRYSSAGNIVYIRQKDKRYSFSKRMIFSILLVVLSAIGIIWFSAHLDNVRAELVAVNQVYVGLSEYNIRLASQITERYTFYEIERFASLYLGMIMPDPSQIVEISVPRQSTIVLNMDGSVIVTENHFWQDLSGFLLDLVRQLFGGA